MKTETTNYCKQIVKQFSRTLSGNCQELTREVLSHALTNILAAQRFILPVGGRIHDDKEFRALAELLEKAGLPETKGKNEFSWLRQGMESSTASAVIKF